MNQASKLCEKVKFNTRFLFNQLTPSHVNKRTTFHGGKKKKKIRGSVISRILDFSNFARTNFREFTPGNNFTRISRTVLYGKMPLRMVSHQMTHF